MQSRQDDDSDGYAVYNGAQQQYDGSSYGYPGYQYQQQDAYAAAYQGGYDQTQYAAYGQQQGYGYDQGYPYQQQDPYAAASYSPGYDPAAQYGGYPAEQQPYAVGYEQPHYQGDQLQPGSDQPADTWQPSA
jgi:hypothetical protein